MPIASHPPTHLFSNGEQKTRQPPFRSLDADVHHHQNHFILNSIRTLDRLEGLVRADFVPPAEPIRTTPHWLEV